MKRTLIVVMALMACLTMNSCAYIIRKIIEEERQEMKAETYFDLADKAYDDEDYQEALRLYTLHIKFHENDEEGFYNRALAYFELDRYQEAIDDLKTAIELKSDYVDAYGNLTWYYIFLNQPDQVLKYAKKSLSLDPFYVLPYTNMGHAYLLKNEVELAVNYYIKGLDDTAVIADFKELREAGITLPNMMKVESLFSKRIASLGGKCNDEHLTDLRHNMHTTQADLKAFYELMGKYPSNILEIQVAAPKVWGQINNPVTGGNSVALVNEGQSTADGVVAYQARDLGYTLFAYCGNGYKVLDEEKFRVFRLTS